MGLLLVNQKFKKRLVFLHGVISKKMNIVVHLSWDKVVLSFEMSRINGLRSLSCGPDGRGGREEIR